jgi:4-hydroxythreonine-4-phosphate dehydrogenase
VSTGDPAGVGPEVSLRAVVQLAADDAVVLYGDAARLRAGAKALGVAADRLRDVGSQQVTSIRAGEIGLVDAGAVPDAIVNAHAPTADGGRAQYHALASATEAALAGHVRGLVTAPVSKEAIVAAGHHFIGHTEYLAHRAGLADDAVTMMFLGQRLSVALVTTHLSVRDAADAITEDRVMRSVRHLHAALIAVGGKRPLRLAVTGLNPHAGEGGLFGVEDVNVIASALVRLRAEHQFASGDVTLIGPRPAEAAFREAAAGKLDGVVAMIHDQATIASKLLDWGNAVNVTWGLPIVRTSVDHGVAYDAAANHSAEADGMIAAFALAQKLTG